jgi:hypothetical protein
VSVARSTGVDVQALKAGFTTNLQTRPRAMPLPHSLQHHNITNLCKVQSTTNSFFIQRDPTSASALLPSIRLRFLVNRLHQARRSR